MINPYTGCVHGCVYCYARFMKRFTGHTEPWGTFLDAKVNAAELLRGQLARRREPFTESVFFSSVTDPYQPAEKQHRLTRSLLEVLLEHQVPIAILTKSDLVLRDVDLLARFASCKVGLSLMTLDDELAHRLEPARPPPVAASRPWPACTRTASAPRPSSAPTCPGSATSTASWPPCPAASTRSASKPSTPAAATGRGSPASWQNTTRTLPNPARAYPKTPPTGTPSKRGSNQLARQHGMDNFGFYRH